MTVSEAAHRWGVPLRTLREKLNINRRPSLKKDIENGLVKYFKAFDSKRGEWIITTDAMTDWYGHEPCLKNIDTGVVKTVYEWTNDAVELFSEKYNDDDYLQDEFETVEEYLKFCENRGYFYTDLVECDERGNEIKYE